ncbi:MAG: PEP-CTERM sorting domain-containing protein [Burkholderiaceae bacterium]
MKPKHALVAATVAITALAATSANAAVTYTLDAQSSFAFNGETVTGSYSFTVANFITSDTAIPLAALSTCSVTASLGPATCLGPDFLYHINGADDQNEMAGLHFESAANPGSEVYYYFAPGSFEHYGTYDSVLFGASQQAVLTVSQASAVPEPSSLGFVAAGLGLLSLATRRARRR